MNKLTLKEFNKKYEYDGHTGLVKCRCCDRIDTDFSMYNEVIDEDTA